MNPELQADIDRVKNQEKCLTFEERYLNGLYYLIGYTNETHPCHPGIFIWHEHHSGGLGYWSQYNELPPALFITPPSREITLEDIELGIEIMEGL